jgi:hypothetical protein
MEETPFQNTKEKFGGKKFTLQRNEVLRKYSVEHFLRNQPKVQSFREFYKKSTVINEFFHNFGIVSAHNGKRIFY